MTSSILKQDPNTQKVQQNSYLLEHKHTSCKFGGVIPFVKLHNVT